MLGVMFEEIMHKWFQTVKPSPVAKFVRSTKGNMGRESVVADLSETLLYWVPSTPNFANMDAAFIDATLGLHCIQYTIRGYCSFDEETFENEFIRN
jgi:hypothetical protein